MKHEFRIDARKRRVVVRYHGLVDLAMVTDLAEAIAAAPRWAPDFDRLIHYDDGAFGEFSAPAMAELTERITAYRRKHYVHPPPPVAHVCEDPVNRVLVKHWLAHVRGDDTDHDRLFSDAAEAEAWLDEQRRARR